MRRTDVDVNPIIGLQAAAVELLLELRGSPEQMLAWPEVSEELVELAEDLYERLGWAAQLREFCNGPPVLFELRRALSTLSRMIPLAQGAGMPATVVEEMESLRHGIGRVLQRGE